MDAICGESSRRAFIRFMAIGEADDEDDIVFFGKRLKFFGVSDAVEEEIAVALVGMFFPGRFYPAERIL